MTAKAICLVILLTAFTNCHAQSTDCLFEVIDCHSGPVLKKGDAGTKANKYGFEGGKAFKLNGLYHLFTTEMIDDPVWVKTRLAYWKSTNGITWQRVSTLYESNGDFTGEDGRAALWGPYPVFDEKKDLWNLFYVAYKCKPNTKKAWLNNYEGRIWRAVSVKPGIEGLAGPYKNIGIVLEPGPDSDRWEGLQGVAGFYPFQVGNIWYAFYGSAHTQKWPCDFWGVGLAKAMALSGPWKRHSQLNPVLIDDVWVENPITTKLDDGSYITLFDGGPRGSFAYATSKDGLNWSKGVTINLEPKVKKWWEKMRTPLGLIPEGDNIFTVFYTAMDGPFKGESTYSCLGVVRLKLKSNSVKEN